MKTLPPWAFLIPCGLCIVFCLIGTSVQVQTSEAWMAQVATTSVPTLSTFVQVMQFVQGKLPDSLIVPFIFAWGTQVALIVGSFGIELPKLPAWRFYGSWILIGLMVFINGAGDWNYSSSYGAWGQAGFCVAIMFLTFVCGFLAIVCFMHAIRKMAAAPATRTA
jgi:hypothetical protein